jgi:hypothetical protein
MAFYNIGRCRSGRRWFWVAERSEHYRPYEQWPRLHGWEDTKEQAEAAARAAAKELGARDDDHGHLHCWEYVGRARLKDINKAKRGARFPTNGQPTEYLFSVVGYTSDQTGETHSWVLAFPIVRKTAARIYYDKRGKQWPHREGGHTSLHCHDGDEVGFVDRHEIEANGFASKRGRYSRDDDTLYLQPQSDWHVTEV